PDEVHVAHDEEALHQHLQDHRDGEEEDGAADGAFGVVVLRVHAAHGLAHSGEESGLGLRRGKLYYLRRVRHLVSGVFLRERRGVVVNRLEHRGPGLQAWRHLATGASSKSLFNTTEDGRGSSLFSRARVIIGAYLQSDLTVFV